MEQLFYTRIIIICFLLVGLTLSYRGDRRFKKRKCEKITIPLCKDIGYNLTYMPNQFSHKTQFDAGLIIHQFWPLVLINCSSRLKHFVCSLYAPMCDPIFHKEIVPCRSFCEEVKDSCEPIMKQNGFKWPDHLKCGNFPTRQENNICMKPSPDKKSPSEKPTVSSAKKGKIPKVKIITPEKPSHKKPPRNTQSKPKPTSKIIRTIIRKKQWNGGCGCLCQSPFVYPNKSQRAGEETPPCALPCKKYFFSENENNFMTFWIGLWSIIAFIATLITILTFLVDRARFDYVERPIILIAFCYVLVSFGYIVRLIYGHEAIACNSKTNLIRYSATGPAQCTAVFILTYFFTNVAWIWWVVLSMNWFLSTGLRWSHDAISSYSQYFHFIAWLIPTVQTMAILAMAAIDGDPVSGLCSVGNHDNNTLTIFVIAPLLIYSMLAFSFFVAGILAIFQLDKKSIVNTQQSVDIKQNRYMSKIGVFTFVLLIPAITLIGCHFYEHNNREAWEKSKNCPCMGNKKTPQFYMFLLKYFMSLMIGLVTGFWVLESRTMSAWKKLLKRCSASQRCQHENNNLLTHHKYPHQPVSL